jgi:hypothetical protein
VVKLYVEGGGDTALLKTACREGFTTFITAAGVKKRPRIVACGGRRDAYDSFCTAVANGEDAFLLVDSEEFVAVEHHSGDPAEWKPWQHLKQRTGDGWDMPRGSTDAACHLMVQVMESWFLTDRDTLKAFFGQGFTENNLPAITVSVDAVAKTSVYDALQSATRNCKTKAPYGKGEHSFKLLAKLNPNKVVAASRWARRFIEQLKTKMDG